MKSSNGKYNLLYGVMIAFFLFIIVFLCIKNHSEPLSAALGSDSADFSIGWKTADGTETDIAKLYKLEGIPAGQEFTVTNVLPQELGSNCSLFFRSKNIFYSVYIDGELVYTPNVPESIFYTNSLGTRWSVIELSPEYGGKNVEIRASKSYESSRAGIDNIQIGNPAGIILSVIVEKLVAVVTCILLIFVGLMLIIADIPLNVQVKKNHELMYLGLFALSIAVWCLSETNIIQFFFDDSRLMQVVSCCSLMLISIPMILYLDSAFGFKNKKLAPAFCILSGAEFVVCWTLHLTGVADIRRTLKLTHIILALSAVIFFYSVIRNSMFIGKSRKRNIYRVFRGIGLSSISIATAVDLVRFYLGVGTDSAMFVRIGLLIFVICYGSSSLENTVNAVKLGVKSEFISKLAYHDGLTGAGNRTAFEERLIELDKVKDSVEGVGIVMFDVNDLKFINDNFGHQYGDNMITKSAEFIGNAFSSENGECFRIGGDEFAVLLSGDDILRRYENGISNFKNAVEEYNSDSENDMRISVAYGFEAYDRAVHSKMVDIYQQADAKMYENKKAIKTVQSRPEEFYKDRIKSSL
ncbi:MAG: GGDEF domain-containing protein [Oscillospiraceae bacterium]